MKRALAGAFALLLALAGWLGRGYVGGVEAAVSDGTSAGDPGEGAFASPAACRALLGAGRRLPVPEGKVRLGSWNLRWFPDGKPGRGATAGGTDVAWLACAIAWLSVDVLAVQEVKAHPAARLKTQALIDELDALTSGKWRLELDDCKSGAIQHVGFLFNEARVKARLGRTYGALNPHGEACKDQLRPGYGAYFRFPGGLDLHAVSVHLKSGTERRALDLRTRSLRALSTVLAEARAAEPDQDVMVLGDFNTMGCGRCRPEVSAERELELLARAAAPAKMVPVPAEIGCSHYFSGRGTLLDLVLVSDATRELPADARVAVSGVCGELRCRSLPAATPRPAAFAALSDHCPILIDLTDRDLD